MTDVQRDIGESVFINDFLTSFSLQSDKEKKDRTLSIITQVIMKTEIIIIMIIPIIVIILAIMILV